MALVSSVTFDNATRDTEAMLLAADVDHELTYPASHGFAVPDSAAYDEAAATRHWQVLESLYGSALTPA